MQKDEDDFNDYYFNRCTLGLYQCLFCSPVHSCPVDNTFHWLSVNGLAQKSRFSVQMFTMPERLPLYIHCLTNICGPDESCVKVNRWVVPSLSFFLLLLVDLFLIMTAGAG